MMNLFIQLWYFLSFKRKSQILILFFLILLSALSEIISLASVIPFLIALTNPTKIWELEIIQNISNLIGITNADQLLFPACLIFSLMALLTAVIRIMSLNLNFKLAALIGSDLSIEVFKRTLFMSYENHLKINSSQTLATATTFITETVQAIRLFLQLITSLIISIAIILVLIKASWIISTIGGLIFIFAYVFIAKTIRKKLRINSNIFTQKSKTQIKIIQEALGSIREIILYNCQKIILWEYGKLDKDLRLRQAESSTLGIFPRYALEALALIVISFTAYQIKDNKNIIPILGTFALGSQRLLPSLQQTYQSWTGIQSFSSSLREVIFRLKKPYKTFQKDLTNEVLEFKERIVLKNITFSYEKGSTKILNGINLEIKKGDKIGIIGETGCGKSTFVDILIGLLNPSTGEFFIDDKNLYDKNNSFISSWRSKIANVPQNIYISDASIIENIAFGIPKEKIDLIKVKKVCGIAQIQSFIESLAYKYETRVGERGVLLSGGQIQRLGIARALYRSAEVIVFDEATSALDNNTEKKLIESIKKYDNNYTIIMIAHRLTSLINCNKIIKLSEGTITLDEI